MLRFQQPMGACPNRKERTMNTRQLTVDLPDNAPAILSLPQPLNAESLGLLEQALAATLAMLRRDLRGDAPDAGAVEYASWMAQLRAARA